MDTHSDDLKEVSKAFGKDVYAKALQKFKLAAKKGNADAQFSLGVMYFKG